MTDYAEIYLNNDNDFQLFNELCRSKIDKSRLLKQSQKVHVVIDN